MSLSHSVIAPSDRAQRLVQGMQQVCSHDLPNQVVALESLLHLFAMDEVDQLSPQGREYLQRLQSVAHKIAGMAQYLRELIRMDRHHADVAEIALDRFVKDLKSELHRQLPEHAFTWNTRFEVERATTDRRLLLQAAAALIQGAVEVLATADLHVTLTSWEDSEGVVALRLTVAPPPTASVLAAPIASAPTTAHRGVASMPLSATTNHDRRLEFALGAELLALAGAACRREEADDAVAFVLTLPSGAEGS